MTSSILGVLYLRTTPLTRKSTPETEEPAKPLGVWLLECRTKTNSPDHKRQSVRDDSICYIDVRLGHPSLWRHFTVSHVRFKINPWHQLVGQDHQPGSPAKGRSQTVLNHHFEIPTELHSTCWWCSWYAQCENHRQPWGIWAVTTGWFQRG